MRQSIPNLARVDVYLAGDGLGDESAWTAEETFRSPR